jgi:DNA-binding transcriptional MocR family regulator
MSVNSFDDYPMSWTPDFSQARGPLYKAIAERLASDIKSGLLTPGTRLPPQRELADFLEINVSTISRAFKLCEQKGLICATIGNGTFVASDAAANSYLLHDEGDGIIELGSVFCETAMHEEVVAQMKKMVLEPDFGKLFRYGRAGGTQWQKESAAKLMQKAGYAAQAENLLLANGAQNAIAAILAGLFQTGDRIGTDEFTYPGLKTAANMLGIRLIPIVQTEQELTEEGLRFACKNEKLSGLYLIPDYHNPTTTTMSERSRKAVATVARQEKLIVIEDAIHSLLKKEPSAAIAAYAPERVVYVSSLSKAVAPGLRIAFIAAPPKFRQPLTAALYNLNISVPPLMAELATRIIVSGTLDAIVEKHRLRNRARNEIVDRYLQGYPVLGEAEGIFRWLLLPPHVSGESFEAEAYQAGVRVYGAERFAVGNAKATNAVRLAIIAPENIRQLEEAMKILSGILEKYTAAAGK